MRAVRAGRSLRLHKILGLGSEVTYARLRSSYQRKVQQCHPDVCGTASAGDCDEFLAVQSAWEEYKDSELWRDAEAKAAAAPFVRSELQMVLLGLTIRCATPPDLLTDDMYRLRTAVMQSVCGLCEQDELAPIGVRRVEWIDRPNAFGAHVHMLADEPSHRDAVVRMCTSSSAALVESLQGTLDAVGWSTGALPVEFGVCLPYSIPEPPPPAQAP